MTPIATLRQRKVRIQKAYLLSCVKRSVDDIAEAAAVMRGKKVAEGSNLRSRGLQRGPG